MADSRRAGVLTFVCDLQEGHGGPHHDLDTDAWWHQGRGAYRIKED